MISRKKRILSLLLALSMTLSISGCGNGKKKSLFEGTLLEGARVFDCDGELVVGVYEYRSDSMWSSDSVHDHYTDLVSGFTFAQECYYGYVKSYNKIKEVGLVSNYLTEEELIKISRDELSEDDINKILIRIVTSENEKKLTLTGK